jgi:hypothetical protein
VKACRHMGDCGNTGNPMRREARSQPDAREGQAGLHRVADRLVVPGKPGNSGGGKGPEREFGNLSGLDKIAEIVIIAGKRHSNFNQGGAQRWKIVRNGSLMTPTYPMPSGGRVLLKLDGREL